MTGPLPLALESVRAYFCICDRVGVQRITKVSRDGSARRAIIGIASQELECDGKSWSQRTYKLRCGRAGRLACEKECTGVR